MRYIYNFNFSEYQNYIKAYLTSSSINIPLQILGDNQIKGTGLYNSSTDEIVFNYEEDLGTEIKERTARLSM